jgi:hypothetical protein
VLAGCAAHSTRVPPTPPVLENASYIDLQPGWRLRVVTPILKSGGYQLRTSNPETSGTITVSAADFIGFETAYYAVSTPPEGGMRIEFLSATITKGGETTPQPTPLVPLFSLPAGVRFVRLIYLTRVSQADHDMAIVASDQKETLDTLTSAVQANAGNCETTRGAFCSWVPAGVAVRPELQKLKSNAWIPAR